MRGTARLAWFLWALSLALNGLFISLVVLSWDWPGPLMLQEDVAVMGVYLLLFLTFPTVGAVIASRKPENIIGWLFCAGGIVMVGGFSAQLYAQYALFGRATALTGGMAAAWVSSWLGITGMFVVPTFLLFLFPDGEPSSSRWRVVVRLAVGIVVLGVMGLMFRPGPLEPFSRFDNPLGAGGALGRLFTALDAMLTITAAPFFLTGGAAILSRLRRARGETRLQLKWFAYAASVMGTCFAVSFLAGPARLTWLSDLFFIAGVVAMATIPVASGVAILKYRLYDIDRIISRTLAYGLLTAFLGGVYFVAVILLQAVLGERITDQPLAVAATTLAVAALFRPARARIQAIIDRRFNRRKYDAERTIEAFGRQLRDRVDLDDLRDDLVAVVMGTMQPAHVSLWLLDASGEPNKYPSVSEAGR